jgi:hypothetical protein
MGLKPSLDDAKQKGRPSQPGRPLILILAVTYVPAQLPAQYHRPGKA